MIEKKVFYTIDGRTANSIRKVLGKIKTVDFKDNYGLSDEEITDIDIYLINVNIEESDTE